MHDGIPGDDTGMTDGLSAISGATAAVRDHVMSFNQCFCDTVAFGAAGKIQRPPVKGYLRRVRLARRCNAARKCADSSGLICSRKWLSTSSERPPASNTSRMSWALCSSRVNVGQYR